VDKSQNKVVMYDVARMPIRAITFPDEPPLSVQVAEDELIITTPSGLLVGNLDGELQMGYIARGKEPGQFDMPGGVTVGEDNTLFVADSLNYRVQALGTDGAVQWTYGEPLPPEQAIQFQDETRKFGLPADIAADEMGFLYIADGTNAEIVVLDAEDGEYVETLGSVGHEDGFFYYPDSIAYANGRLVIADTFNDRVQVFRVPTPLGIFGRILPLAPWLLLPLALLLLIPLFRRRTNVVTPGFAQRMNVDARGPEVAEALKKVAAAPGLVEAFEEAFEGLSWKAIEPADDRVKALAEEHGLSEADAQALDVALHKRGRKVLLVDDAKLAQLAREYELSVVTYQDVLDSLGPAEAEAPASASSAADDAWASEDEGGKDA
jgi:predicted nucleic acid-binding protein